VPATVHAMLAARIDRLPSEDKDLLQTASVVGTDVPVAVLAAVACGPADILPASLARLQAAEFLYETRMFPDAAYTFKHALTNEVAYGSLLQERRRALHARAVKAIEGLYPERLAEHVDRLATVGIDNRVVDSGSIEVNRRRRRAKSDGLDARKLVTMLVRYHAGESRVWSVVRIPTVEQEDRRQLHRELRMWKQERGRVTSSNSKTLPAGRRLRNPSSAPKPDFNPPRDGQALRDPRDHDGTAQPDGWK